MTDISAAQSLISAERARFHEQAVSRGLLVIDKYGVASNADKGNQLSVAYGLAVAEKLHAKEVEKRAAGQSSGKLFEELVAEFLSRTFPELHHLRAGRWDIHRVGNTGPSAGVDKFAQYSHLDELNQAVLRNPELRTVLGNDYAIAPDVVIARNPEPDEVINDGRNLIDESVAQHADLRERFQPLPILHAIISCKWSLRSDRAQNARSEALNLIRNRKGALPHIAVITAEPAPTRISSLALGTGDVDCVYHFALPELVAAISSFAYSDGRDLINMMIQGKRLKDISDLPLDLAV